MLLKIFSQFFINIPTSLWSLAHFMVWTLGVNQRLISIVFFSRRACITMMHHRSITNDGEWKFKKGKMMHGWWMIVMLLYNFCFVLFLQMRRVYTKPFLLLSYVVLYHIFIVQVQWTYSLTPFSSFYFLFFIFHFPTLWLFKTYVSLQVRETMHS